MQRAAGAPTCPQQISAPPYGPAPPNGESLSSLSTLPGSRSSACTSRRRFVIHVRVPKAFHARTARLQIGRRSHAARIHIHARVMTIAVDLRGQPRGITRVRLTIRGTSHRTIRASRTYRLCRHRRARRRPATRSRRI
jgi:hypothetical protein